MMANEELDKQKEEKVHIEASQLGNKDYWETRYQMEMENYKESGDEGEIWFGRSAENRIVKYITSQYKDLSTKILDLGSGNGSVLRRLREKGYTNLTGYDYSETAVDLATKASEEEEDAEEVEISFKVFDILNSEDRAKLNGGFDLILDKGTWDAMYLCPEGEREKRLESYIETLVGATKSSEIIKPAEFVIVSCNFTVDELRQQFETKFQFKEEIPAVSSFTFGGSKGVTSAGAVFRIFLAV